MNRLKEIFNFRCLLVTALIITISSCNDDNEIIVEPDKFENISLKLINDEFEGSQFVVYGDPNQSLFLAFDRQTSDGTLLDFDILKSSLPTILIDNEGNQWDIFGEAIDGPRLGERLTPINGYAGYWFSIASIFPKVNLYGEAASAKIELEKPDPDWGVDINMVFRATFIDAIPALNFPNFKIIDKTDILDNPFLEDKDLLFLLKIGNSYKAYPHSVLDWHEIVNDSELGAQFTLSYCPLTGTGVAWLDNTSNEAKGFGVSGLLYNNNLILYDRKTESYWSQMLQRSIHGLRLNETPETIQLVEMNWKTLKSIDGEIKLMSFDTGFDRNYNDYPYGDYRTNDAFITFPLNFIDDRVPGKEKVFAAIINEKAKVYRFKDFVK